MRRCSLLWTVVDLSRNRFAEVPSDICNCSSVEHLNCYHNVIKSLPVAIVQLQNLVCLNLRYRAWSEGFRVYHVRWTWGVECFCIMTKLCQQMVLICLR